MDNDIPGWQALFARHVWPLIKSRVGRALLVIGDEAVNALNRQYLGGTYKGVVKAWGISAGGPPPLPIKCAVQRRLATKPPYQDFTVRQAIRRKGGEWSYNTEHAKLTKLAGEGRLDGMVTVRSAVTKDGQAGLLEVAMVPTLTLLDHCEPEYLETNQYDGNQFFAVPFSVLPEMTLWRATPQGQLERAEHVYQTSLL